MSEEVIWLTGHAQMVAAATLVLPYSFNDDQNYSNLHADNYRSSP